MSWRQKIRNNLKLKLLACASSLFIFGVSETLDKQNQKKTFLKFVCGLPLEAKPSKVPTWVPTYKAFLVRGHEIS
jgi:hypothetical protein